MIFAELRDPIDFNGKPIKKVKIVWKHEPDSKFAYRGDVTGEWLMMRGQTECKVYSLDKEVVLAGVAMCRDEDQFVKAEGCRWSLLDAASHLTRRQRQDLMEPFNNRFPSKEQKQLQHG